MGSGVEVGGLRVECKGRDRHGCELQEACSHDRKTQVLALTPSGKFPHPEETFELRLRGTPRMSTPAKKHAMKGKLALRLTKLCLQTVAVTSGGVTPAHRGGWRQAWSSTAF